MITIGRHWTAARGDRQARCDYCGIFWLRSQLTMDEAGLMRCPDEGDGADMVECSRENAEGATEYMGRLPREEGGVPPATNVDLAVTPLRTRIGGTF